ncbi:MAG TPA: alpha/beta fold hydrolase [Vicinamibacterales bacterium]|nr:alpha/beta fold hydrolase [Vicinamibacterales bacterium]
MRRIGRLRYLEVPPAGALRPAGALVFIHGFPLSPTMWDPQVSLAERGWRLIVPELRGFGVGKEAAGDPATTSIDDFAGDTIDLLDKLHVDTAVICGLSMGGYIAFSMFRHAPNYFRAMVLADTRSQGDSPEAVAGRKNMQQLAREKGTAAVADALLPKLVGDTTRRERPDVVEAIRRQVTGNSVEGIVGALTALMTRPDSTSMLSTIRCPVQIIVGSEDAITPPPLSEQMHHDIPGSELTVIKGAGHMSNMEQPALFTDTLVRFLEHRV